MSDDKKTDGKGPGGPAAGSAVNKAASRPAVPAEVKTETRGRKTAAEIKLENTLDNLLRPENVGHLVSVPFDISQAMTGSSTFELTNDERAVLASTGAAALKEVGITDTKWLSLGIFGMALLNIYGTKFAAFRREQKEKAKHDNAADKKA